MSQRLSRIEFLEQRKLLAAADPVWTFGDHGLVQDNRQIADGAVAAQPDGKTLFARVLGQPNATPGQTWLTRYLADGSPDPAFGAANNGQPQGIPPGTVPVLIEPLFQDIAKVMVGPNGNIFIAGTIISPAD